MIQAPGRLDSIVARRSCPWEFFSSLLEVGIDRVKAVSDAWRQTRTIRHGEVAREQLHAHESYFASYGDSFIFRGPIRSADGADNIGTALLIELPNRAAADRFWNEEPPCVTLIRR
jgi:hypothetical protein